MISFLLGINPSFAATSGSVDLGLSFGGSGASTYLSIQTVGASFIPDCQVANYWRLQMTSATNFTLLHPNNCVDGQSLTFEIIQPASGTVDTVTLGSVYAFGTDITSYTATATLGKRDFIGCKYNLPLNKCYIIAVVHGY